MHSLICLVVVFAGLVSAQPASQPVWQANFRYEYKVDSRTWRAPADDETPAPLPRTFVEDFNPPVGPQNFGFRCHVELEPVQREWWPSSTPHDADRAPLRQSSLEPSEGHSAFRHRSGNSSPAANEENAWLVRAQLHSCAQTRSRFHGPFIVVAGGADSKNHDPIIAHAGTPFYFVHSDDGRLRELYFFGNESLPTRNFKRGMVSFLNLVRPESTGIRDLPRRLSKGSVVEYQTVDHDEQGVCVLWWTADG